MKKGLTVTSGIVTMVTSMMGVGINYMPRTFKYVDTGYGCISGVIAMVGVGLLTFFSLCIISISARKSKDPNPTYSSLAQPISRTLKVLVDMSVFGACFGANMIFYRYLSELAVKMFTSIKACAGSEEAARKMVVWVLSVPFFFLASKKDLSSLKIASYTTVTSVTYLAVLMVGYAIFIGRTCAEEPRTGTDSGPNVSKGVPALVLAMACQANMVKVYGELENKSTRNIVKIAFGAALFGTLIYGAVGMCGYIVFGRAVDTTIIDYLIDPNSTINVYLMNNTFDKYALTSRAACIGTMLVLFGGFPIQLNPLSGLLMSYLPSSSPNDNKKRILTIFMLVAVLLSITLIEKIDTNTVLGIIGATAVNLTSFLYPSIYYIYAVGKVNAMTVLSALLATFSIAAMFYMTYNILMLE